LSPFCCAYEPVVKKSHKSGTKAARKSAIFTTASQYAQKVFKPNVFPGVSDQIKLLAGLRQLTPINAS